MNQLIGQNIFTHTETCLVKVYFCDVNGKKGGVCYKKSIYVAVCGGVDNSILLVHNVETCKLISSFGSFKATLIEHKNLNVKNLQRLNSRVTKTKITLEIRKTFLALRLSFFFVVVFLV